VKVRQPKTDVLTAEPRRGRPVICRTFYASECFVALDGATGEEQLSHLGTGAFTEAHFAAAEKTVARVQTKFQAGGVATNSDGTCP